MPRSDPGSLGSLRQRNRLWVLEAIMTSDAVSRADIARQTGLAPSTVSNLVGGLQREGLVVERVDRPGTANGGRPPVLLSVDPGAGAVLGLHFDHSVLRIALGDLGHQILAEKHLSADLDGDAAAGLDAVARLTEDVLAEAAVPPERLIGAGVALAAPLQADSATVASTTIMPGWVGLDVPAELERRLGVPVHVDNDANLGALAESVLGAGGGARDMAYVMLSSGIGCGLVLDGRIYRGAGGTAGEIGHVLVDERGRLCRCGNRGCLETYAGAHALLELLDREGTTVDGLVELAVGGDPAARRLVADAGRVVGHAVAVLCNQFNPERVVVGGELAATGNLLLDPIRDGVERFAMPAAASRVEIVSGALGDRAELLGALVLAVGRSDQALSGLARAAAGSAVR